MTGDELLVESARRWQRLRYPYDPVTGEGSHEPRRALRIVPDAGPDGRPVDAGGVPAVVMLPEPMFEADGPERRADVAALLADVEAAGSLAEYCKANGHDLAGAWHALSLVRLLFDVEFWTATCVKIKGDAGGVVPFRLRHPQRLYLRVLLSMFWAGVPIAVVVLKARQWGGSTLTQIFFAWVQLFHRRGWNSAIVADKQSQSGHILGMFEDLAEHYPEEIGAVTLRPYKRLQTVRRVVERDCYIGVGSVQEPDAVRGYTFHMLHLSEVGLWESKPKQSADALAQSLIGGLASGMEALPASAVVMESTAKGVGSYFHKEWLAAEKGESSRAAFFLPWHAIEKYSVSLPTLDNETPAETAARFAESWDAYERWLWDSEGCTLEQILYYRRRLMGFRGRRYQMQAEYPTTALEAFQSTGNRYYTPEAVSRARATCRPPARRGSLRASERNGKGALAGIRFVDDELGPLSVWRMPDDTYGRLIRRGPDGRPLPIRHRFVIFFDPGGKADTSDWSVAKVIDRAPMLWGGRPEVVAVFRVHMRPDLAAWAVATLGAWYTDAGEAALVAIEVNRYRKSGDAERGLEPEWAITTIEEIAGVYPNLFRRQAVGKDIEEWLWEIGFFTTKGTKEMLVQGLDRALEDELYVERSANGCDELDTYEQRPDGTFGSRVGCHDDEAIATMGAVWLALDYDRLPPPAYIEPAGPTKPAKPKRMSRL